MPEARSPSPSEAQPHGSRVAVARNAVSLMLGQVATTTLAVVLSAALGRSLGPADFGLYFLILASSQFAFVVVEWGQVLFVVREMARAPARVGAFLGSSLAIRIGGAALAAVPVGVVTGLLGYDARTAWLASGFVLASLPASLSQGFGMAFRSADRMGLDAAVSVVNKAALLALVLPILALGAGVPGVVAAQAAAGLVALGTASWLYRRSGAAPLRSDRATVREVLLGGLPVLFMMVTVSVQPYLDAVILSRLSPPDVVGWYGAAKNVMGTLVAPAVILASAWYPRLSRVGNDPPAFRLELRSAVMPLLWLGALGGIGTFQFADVAIGLIFGLARYRPAVLVLQVYGAGMFLLFVDVLLGHLVTAVGKAKEFAIAKFASVLVAVGLQLWLVPLFQDRIGNGGVGVVVAVAISEVIVFVSSIALLPPGSVDPRLFLDGGRALASAAVALAAYRMLPEPGPVLGIPLLVALFSAASIAFGLVRRSDLALLRSMVRRGR